MCLSRAQLLKNGAALTVFAPALIASMVKEAEAASPGDIELLNGAIELENAGIKAYSDAFSLNLLSPPLLAVAQSARGDHEAHAAALTAAVKVAGGTPTTATAKLEYPSLKSQADYLHSPKRLSVSRQHRT